MARIFISYKRADKDVVFPIKDQIEAAIGEPCWIDLDGIESDAQFEHVIINAIDKAEVFLFMYSKTHYLITDYANDWTVKEIRYADAMGKRIVFVNLDQSPLEKWFLFNFSGKQQIDATSESAFARLMDDMKEWLSISSSENQTRKITANTYSIRLSVDETCELFVDDVKKRKIKANSQSVVEGFVIGQKYQLSFRSLARANSVINIDCSQMSVGPNQIFDMQISFEEKRRKEEEKAKAKKQAAKQEKERERERDGFLQQALSVYDEHDKASDGFFRVKKDKLYGFVNEDGFEIVPCMYDNASYFFGPYATVCQNNKWGVVDRYGQIVLDLVSDCPCWSISDGKYIIVGKQGKFAITTLEKGFPNAFPYNEVSLVANYIDVFWVRDEKGWKLISLSDMQIPFTMIVSDIKTHCITLDFHDHYDQYFFSSKHLGEGIRLAYLPMCVKSAYTNRWGIINTQLKLSIPFVDEMADNFISHDKRKVIQTNNKQGIADAEKGVFIVPCVHDRIERVDFEGYIEDFYQVMDDLSVTGQSSHFCYGGRQGIVDIDGNTVVPMNYQYIMERGDANRDLVNFACLLAPDFRSGQDSNGDSSWFKFNPDKAFVHVYDIKGNLIEKTPYRQNKYFGWYL